MQEARETNCIKMFHLTRVLCTGVLWGGIGDGASSHISFIMEKLRIMNIRQPPPQGNSRPVYDPHEPMSAEKFKTMRMEEENNDDDGKKKK